MQSGLLQVHQERCACKPWILSASLQLHTYVVYPLLPTAIHSYEIAVAAAQLQMFLYIIIILTILYTIHAYMYI